MSLLHTCDLPGSTLSLTSWAAFLAASTGCLEAGWPDMVNEWH